MEYITKQSLSLKGLLLWFIANTLAGGLIGLAIGLITADRVLSEIIWISILFSNVVGFASGLSAIYLLPHYSRLPLIADIILRMFTLFSVGVSGSVVVIFLYPLFFLYETENTILIIMIDGIVALIIGSVVYTYEKMKVQIEEGYRQLNEQRELEAKLRELAAKAELKALKAQINPHFLFNTLNSISTLISTDPDKAKETLFQLSSLLRFVLDAADKELITLREEIDLIDSYLEIEKARFGKRLKVKKCIDPKSEEVKIPALILQPLIENAVKHGISPKTDGGTISINTECINNFVEIRISDNGIGFTDTEERESDSSHGLKNVNDRLTKIYGDESKFEVKSEQGKGTRISFRISVS